MKTHLIILLIFTVFADIAKGADPFAIKLNNSSPVQFCTQPVLVAKDLTIEGTTNIVGMKISFSGGYVADEDELVYSGSLTKSIPSPGTLQLTGSSNVQDYVDAIRTITYKNSKFPPTLGVRNITISLDDVDYLLATGHFYRYISKSGIKWTEANAEARSDAMMYYGLRGYLATVTSQAENDFIKIKTKSIGWIGASDAAVEGDWRWVTGPEGLEDNGKGRLFWRGKGADYAANVPGTGPIQGAYTNWNTGEPNDCCNPATTHNEDYAHITVFPTNPFNSYKWNDLPNAGTSGDYYPAGYLIEFGGYPNEPTLNLFATLDLQVNTMMFKTETFPAICEGESVTLNQPDLNTIPALYSWTPAGSLSSASIANPVASPSIPTTYTVIGTRGACTDSAHYAVPVNPKPVSLLKAEENICKGQSVTLNPGVYPNYSWSNGAITQKITVDVAGDYSVKLTSDKGCPGTSVSKVIVHDYPTIDLSKLQSLICGEPKATTVNITTNAVDFSLKSIDNKATVNGLAVNVPIDGIYPMVYKATIYPACAVDTTFDLSFYKIPKVDFTIEAKKCSGYNLLARYVGDADTIVSNFKWVFRGDVIANETGLNSLIVPLGINRSQRDLTLTVTQDGCFNSFTQNISVIPNLNLHIVDNLGCEPFNAEFKARNTEIVKYFWDFGDNTPVIEGDSIISHSYQKAGFYDVKLKVTTIVQTGESCTNEVKIDSMVHVAPIPDVKFSLSPDTCLNPGVNEISYSGAIGTVRDQYEWNLSRFDGSEIIKDPQQTKGPLIFDLKTQPTVLIGLKVTSEFGCKSLPDSILLKRKPAFSIRSDTIAGCIPFEPVLSGIINDPVDKVSFTWDFGDGTIGTGSQVSHTYEQPDQNYNITLTGISSVTGCSNMLIKNNYLRTYPKPKAAFSLDNKIVYNDKPDVKFTDLSEGATTWLWDFGDGVTSALQNPSYHFMKVGHQKVVLEVANTDFCTDTVSHEVLVAFDRLFPPNGFSPNAPNVVDREFLLNSEGLTSEGYHFTVISRWNDVVFETKDVIKGWDGRMKDDTFAPAGVYLWMLSYTDFLGRKHRQTGTVTLVY